MISNEDFFPNSFNFQAREWHSSNAGFIVPSQTFRARQNEVTPLEIARSSASMHLSTCTLQGCARFVVIKWNFFYATFV